MTRARELEFEKEIRECDRSDPERCVLREHFHGIYEKDFQEALRLIVELGDESELLIDAFKTDPTNKNYIEGCERAWRRYFEQAKELIAKHRRELGY